VFHIKRENEIGRKETQLSYNTINLLLEIRVYVWVADTYEQKKKK